MKIIALSDADKYLIEANKTELFNLTGAISAYYAEESHPLKRTERAWNSSLVIGTVFNVNAMFEHIRTLGIHQSELKKIAETLRAAATIIETTPNPLTLPPAEPTSL